MLGYIHCCGGKRKCKSYTVSPQDGFLLVEMDFLEECPVCGHSVIQITRIDLNNKISVYRKNNKKAKKLFNKLRSLILFKGKTSSKIYSHGSTFYLNYNEYGKKKKCYSNLSSLKIGKFDNFDFPNKKMTSYTSNYPRSDDIMSL